MEKLEQDMVDQIVKECEEFFEIGPIPLPEINFIYTREEMDTLLGRKTERWERAVCVYGKLTFIHPSKTLELTTHTNDDFWKVVKHEMAHWFYTDITGTHRPKWFNEGLANVVAESPRQRPKSLDEPVVDKYFAKSESFTYAWGYWMVKYLLDEYGKEKLVELTKSLTDNEVTKEFFAKQFMEIYDFDVAKLQGRATDKLEGSK